MTAIDLMTVDTLLAHSEFVRGVARALVTDPAAADDAVQQTWLEACERPPRDTRSPRGWLATVTRQAVLKIRRGERRRDSREAVAAQPECVPSAAEIAEREETRRKLLDAVLALDTPYRSAIVLRYLEELPSREVARRLGVPVETARTRIKRGLEQLRGALDRAWGGDRRAWGLALVPWTLPSAARSGAPSFAIAAAVTVALTATLAVWWANGSDDAGSTPVELASATSTVDGTNDLQPPMRGTVANRRVSIAPRPITTQDKPGKLRLSTKLEQPVVTPRDNVVLTATFENTGGGTLKFFTPEHVDLVPFPRWRFIHDDGTTYAPGPPMFQSMWTTGIQGTIRELAPTGHWSTVVRVTRFRRLGKNAARNTVRLPAGRYRVRCVYTQENDSVPYGEAMFKHREEKVAGLWAGQVTAADIWLIVREATIPSLAMRAGRNLVMGGPAPVELIVHNPSDKPITLGSLRVTTHSKGWGSGSAILPAAALSLVGDEATPDRLEVPTGGTIRVRIDLAQIAFQSTRRKDGVTRTVGIFELSPYALSCSAAWSVEGAEQPLRSSSDLLTFRPRKAGAVDKLKLTVLPAGGTRIQIRLANGGPKTVRVRKRLSWPTDLLVKFVDVDKKRGTAISVTTSGGLDDGFVSGRRARIAKGLSWNGSNYDRPGPLTPADFTDLASGGTLWRTLDLAEMVHGDIPAGRYEVRATWHSLTDGRHLGLARALVGMLESEPTIIQVK